MIKEAMMQRVAVETLRDFAELVALGAFLTMIALAARAFGAWREASAGLLAAAFADLAFDPARRVGWKSRRKPLKSLKTAMGIAPCYGSHWAPFRAPFQGIT
jgi:hypothetical protein